MFFYLGPVFLVYNSREAYGMKKKKWLIILPIILLVIIIIIVCENSKRGSGGATAERKIEESMKQQYTFDDVTELKKFVLKNQVGSISVKKSEDATLSVETEAIITVYNKEDLEVVKNRIEIQKSIEEMQCEISVKDKDGEDLWKWLDRNIENYNVSIELTVKVPNNFDTFELETECGNIEVIGIGGEMKIKGETGNLLIDSCQFENESILETECGNIQFLACSDLEHMSDVSIETECGNIEIISEESPIEYIKKDEDFMELMINDKCNVKAKVETGIIKVNEEKSNEIE